VAIEFLGIDNSAEIWINGKPAGRHEGALTPFTIDVTQLVKVGDDNTITVKVTNPEYGTRVWTNEQIIATSGLWRDVYLEITSSDCVSDIFAVAQYRYLHC
jgi:beta-galactosidase